MAFLPTPSYTVIRLTPLRSPRTLSTSYPHPWTRTVLPGVGRSPCRSSAASFGLWSSHGHRWIAGRPHRVLLPTQVRRCSPADSAALVGLCTNASHASQRSCDEYRKAPSWSGSVFFPAEQQDETLMADTASSELLIPLCLSRRAVRLPPLTAAKVQLPTPHCIAERFLVSSPRLTATFPCLQLCTCHQLPVTGPPNTPSPCYCAKNGHSLSAEQVKDAVTLPPSEMVAFSPDAVLLLRAAALPRCPTFSNFVFQQLCTLDSLNAGILVDEVGRLLFASTLPSYR